MDTTNNLGEAISERRKAKNLRLKQVADMSGVSVSHLGRIERGERFPTGHILMRLAGPLGFSEFELCKLAGFIPRDTIDDRLESLKNRIKEDLFNSVVSLCEKIDRL